VFFTPPPNICFSNLKKVEEKVFNLEMMKKNSFQSRLLSDPASNRKFDAI